jgi:integrase/recombinase XerD
MSDQRNHPADDMSDPAGFGALLTRYLAAAETRYSPGTMPGLNRSLRRFTLWCAERDLKRPRDLTRADVEHYRRWLHHRRKAPTAAEATAGKDGQPLGSRTQQTELNTVRLFFRWLARQNLILFNPASEVELPRAPKHLPRDVLSAAEMERVLNQVDFRKRMALRDRAILETLYSTAIRRGELAALTAGDLDTGHGTLRIRPGKGRYERVVPIGSRAIAWIERYLAELRPALVGGGSGFVDPTTNPSTNHELRTTNAKHSANHEPPTTNLFLRADGKPLTPTALDGMLRKLLARAGFGHRGRAHLFRHTTATLMLEGGADIRYIQAMLGHAELTTTQIYTRVSIQKLKAVHTASHPGARLGRHARMLEEERNAAAKAEAGGSESGSLRESGPSAVESSKAGVMSHESGETDDTHSFCATNHQPRTPNRKRSAATPGPPIGSPARPGARRHGAAKRAGEDRRAEHGARAGSRSVRRGR